jgi:hypothetical protein|nr:MAG TPA: PcfK-like protein [Caudoviricetes sp.]
MYEKFGEFDSFEELNRAAAAQKAEGDEEALFALAQENGLDKEDVEDYLDGIVEELATVSMAAIGKLKLEKEDLKLGGVLSDWVDELMEMCMESQELAAAVRKKGKDLAGYLAATADSGWKNRVIVDKRIVNKTKEVKKIIGTHEFAIGIPDRKTRRELARAYYLKVTK